MNEMKRLSMATMKKSQSQGAVNGSDEAEQS